MRKWQRREGKRHRIQLDCMYHNNTSPGSIFIFPVDFLSGGGTESASGVIDRTRRNVHPFLNLMTINEANAYIIESMRYIAKHQQRMNAR